MERDVAAMLASGMDALERQDLPAADHCFRRVLGRQPANHGAWNALAWTYLRSGEAQLALGAALRGWPGTVLLLQRGARPEDAAQFALGLEARTHDLSALGDDLRALLRVLAVLDEYVGVSNTNMHLLAGLRRTARVLVPRPPEWRWMQEGDESPWFPGFPVYRQPVSRDWSEPLARLREDLRR